MNIAEKYYRATWGQDLNVFCERRLRRIRFLEEEITQFSELTANTEAYTREKNKVVMKVYLLGSLILLSVGRLFFAASRSFGFDDVEEVNNRVARHCGYAMFGIFCLYQ